MEEMCCYKCNNSASEVNPQDIPSISNDCTIPSILKKLVLDGNRIYCSCFILKIRE